MIRRAKREEGFATPALALGLAIVVLALGGLSIDLWRILSEHGRLAGITDAAAIAGAGGIDTARLYVGASDTPVLDEDAATRLACRYLVEHLGSAACPGPEARIAVADTSITVTTRKVVPLSLLRLLLVSSGGSPNVEVTAQAAAMPLRSAAADP